MLETPPPGSIASQEISLGEGAGLAPLTDFELARTKRLGIAGWLAIGWMVFVVLFAVIGSTVWNPEPDTSVLPLGPFNDMSHPLGLDGTGQDMVWLLSVGAWNSLRVALGAITLGLLVGGTLGLFSGYFRGALDSVLTMVFNVLLAIPQLVLAIALVSVLATPVANSDGIQVPPSETRRLLVLILALGIVSIPILARITRANALQWSQREFVAAARAQGAGNLRVMLREVLPNVLPAMFSIALLGVAVAIVAEGGLSVLGVGVMPPAVSWGQIIAVGRTEMVEQPWVVFAPVIMIFLTVLSLNFLGDVVRARFDVRESTL